MKPVQSFNDVNVALKQLEDRVNLLNVPDVVDWKKRRIGNASPSVDAYDYVVRKELQEFLAGASSVFKVSKGGGVTVTYAIAVFGVSIDENLSVGTDLCPAHIAPFDGKFLKAYFKLKGPCTGTTVNIDINLHGSASGSILGSNLLKIPVNDVTVKQSTIFAITSMKEGDYLTLDIKQVGSTLPGKTLIVKLKYQLL